MHIVHVEMKVVSTLSETELIKKLKLFDTDIFTEYELIENDRNQKVFKANIDLKESLYYFNDFVYQVEHYKDYIRSIATDFESYNICYKTDRECEVCGNFEVDYDYIDVTGKITFEFNINDDLNSVHVLLNDIESEDEDILEINTNHLEIIGLSNVYQKFEDMVLDGDSAISTQWWRYEPDGSLILTDYIKQLDRGIYVGDGKETLIELRNQLNPLLLP